MHPDRTIDVGGQSHTIRFGQYALFLMEKETGRGVETFGTVPNFSASYLMLYAGLECARVKYRSRPQPWTMAEVGELIEAAGGMESLQSVILDAWFAAFPAAKTAMESGNGKGAGESKNEQPQAGPAGKSGSSKRLKSA